MIERAEKPTSERDARDCATAWFAVLERAKQAGDFATAARAVQELERLGVKVKYQKPKGTTDER